MKRLQAIFVCLLMLGTHRVVAQQMNLPILCTPSATTGQPYRDVQITHEVTLVMPYTVNCSPGNSVNGCSYSLTFDMFQWVFYNGAWQYRAIEDDAQSYDIDCGAKVNTTYWVPNLTDYGPGSYWAVLTLWPSATPGVGTPMALRWVFFNQ